MEVFTIGFTRKTAAEFFGLLRQAHIERLVDVRLNNSSQLAGFTRRADLSFFLQELCAAEYRHEPLLAPSTELLAAHRKRECSWEAYERRFLALMAERQIEQRLSPDLFRPATALLCSEAGPERCHRRLVLEYLEPCWGPFSVSNL